MYSYNNFNFDRKYFKTITDNLSSTDLDSRARIFADGTEYNLFRVGFDSLRCITLGQVFIRMVSTLAYVSRIQDMVMIRAHSFHYPERIEANVKVLFYFTL